MKVFQLRKPPAAKPTSLTAIPMFLTQLCALLEPLTWHRDAVRAMLDPAGADINLRSGCYSIFSGTGLYVVQ